MHNSVPEPSTILLLAVTLLGLVIAIIANSATRKAGWILLAFFLGVPLVLVPLAGFYWFQASKSQAERRLIPRDDVTVIHQKINAQGTQSLKWDHDTDAKEKVSNTYWNADGTPYVEEPAASAIDPFSETSTENRPSNSTRKESAAKTLSNSLRAQREANAAGMKNVRKQNTNRPATLAEAPSASPEEKQPFDKALSEKSAAWIDALSKVLAKTILEDRRAWEDLAAKATKQMEQTAEKAEPPAEAKVETRAVEKTVSVAPEPPAPPKPSWVGQTWHGLSGSDVFFERDVEIYAYPTRLEAEAKLPEAVQKAIDEYVELYYGDTHTKVKIPPEELRQFVRDKYEEWRETSLGKMLTLHVNLRIDKRGFEDRYKTSTAQYVELDRQKFAERRLWTFGAYSSAAFLLLTVAWGYLKADLASGGRRRGILRAVATLVILAIVAAVAMMA
jgi:hypothetical protein